MACVQIAALVILAVFPIFGAGDTCLSPQVSPKVYTTSEVMMSSETVVIIEFSVTCKNGVKDLNLYAEFNGKTVPASREQGSNFYQVSFSDEHKKIPSGTYNVRFFDEEAYADLRKAQRSGEDTSEIKSLFSIPISHQGASRGPWVQSEFVAASVAILVWYLAYSARSNMQS